MSSQKVVSLYGQEIAHDEPDAGVVHFCKDLLRRAETGQIKAIATAFIGPNGNPRDGWFRGEPDAHRHDLMAAITYLQVRYAQTINDNSDRDSD